MDDLVFPVRLSARLCVICQPGRMTRSVGFCFSVSFIHLFSKNKVSYVGTKESKAMDCSVPISARLFGRDLFRLRVSTLGSLASRDSIPARISFCSGFRSDVKSWIVSGVNRTPYIVGHYRPGSLDLQRSVCVKALPPRLAISAPTVELSGAAMIDQKDCQPKRLRQRPASYRAAQPRPLQRLVSPRCRWLLLLVRVTDCAATRSTHPGIPECQRRWLPCR